MQSNGNHKQNEKTTTKEGKYLPIIYLIRGEHPEYIKNSYNSTTKRLKLLKIGQTTWIDISPKIYQWPKVREKMLNITNN